MTGAAPLDCPGGSARCVLQTPPGKGGIAVILLSGPEAGRILSAVFRPLRTHADDAQDVLRLGRLVRDGEVLDEAVVCRRGDAYEINIHGGPAVAKAAMELLARHGARVLPASPSAPESFPLAHPRWNNPAVGRELLDALALARTELVAAVLSRQWSAGLSEMARGMVEGALALSAEQLRRAACGLAVARRLLHPPEVVLAGPPNVGKSTLANALVGRQVSIVHGEPGTTRDWVRELAAPDGVPVWLTDTAGVWEARPRASVDAEAVRRARGVVQKADLVILLDDAGAFEDLGWRLPGAVLRVATKRDLGAPAGQADVCVSAHTGEGLDELRAAVLRALGLGDLDASRTTVFTERQASLLLAAADATDRGRAGDAAKALVELLEGKESPP
jgi:tRNA modification GTPase